MSRQLKSRAMEGLSVLQSQQQKSANSVGNKLLSQGDGKVITIQHHVNKRHLGKLIGKGGINVQRLRNETGTSINVDNKTGVVTIRGTKEGIAQVKLEVDQLSNTHKREHPTHFLSLPVQSPILSEKVKELSKYTAIDPESLITSQNLHITLGVMRLLNQIELDRALKVLTEECSTIIEEIVGVNELVVKLDKFKIMQSNPCKARVLYIDPIDERGIFDKLCKTVIGKMVSEGILEKEKRAFKPHVTLINASHSKHQRSFDAAPILEDNTNTDFGSVTLKELHLMKMGRTGPNRTYESKGFIHIT